MVALRFTINYYNKTKRMIQRSLAALALVIVIY